MPEVDDAGLFAEVGKTVGHMASVVSDARSGIRFMSRPAAGGMRIGFLYVPV